MPTRLQADESQEALIVLRQEPTLPPSNRLLALEQAINVIENNDGHVLMSYPPRAMVALLPLDKGGELVGQADIESVDTDLISNERIARELSDLRFVLLAWNERIKARQQRGSQRQESLAWDAPGYLPPDPPAHIQ